MTPKVFWFALTLLAFSCSPGVAQKKKQQAPVVIIMADQLRFDVLDGFAPNIAALRSDGVEFSNAYCASPICVPSRGSFFTGRYPNRTGSLINGWREEDEAFARVNDGIPNLISAMETNWDSWHIGKQHFFTRSQIDKDPKAKTRWITQQHYTQWIKERNIPKPGGKEFRAAVPEMVSGEHTHTREYSIPLVQLYDHGAENYIDHYIASQSVAAIKNRDKRKPLLLNAMFLAPHPPFHVPEPYFSMYTEQEIQVPDNVGKWYAGQSPLQLYNLTGFLGTRYSTADWRTVWTKYLGLVRLLDDQVGRIIHALKEEGLYDEALIVFTADHGEMLGSHSLWQKMCMYEESARVPLIVKLPRKEGKLIDRVDTPVSLVDVFPTVLDYNGLAVPADVDGHSLLPLLKGDGQKRPPVFIQYDGNGSLGNFQRCLVDGQFKIIVDIFKDEHYVELYDLSTDPQEQWNLAFNPDHKRRTSDMLKMLDNIMVKSGDRLTLPDNLLESFLVNYKTMPQK